MEVCSTGTPNLTKLPLDRSVPLTALERRGAISFSSGSSNPVLPRFERRGGISYEKTDKKTLYVRMLGDVKLQSRVEYPRTDKRPSSTIVASTVNAQESVPTKGNRSRYSTRFQSLHKVRQKRPLARVSHENCTVLDDVYSGQAQCLLSKVGDWNFNVFTLDKLTNGRALFFMGMHLFQESQLLERFQLDVVKLMKCLTMIEDGYHCNPYHNAVHAADVTQAMHCYLTEKLISSHIRPVEILASLLASIAHDLDHPGVNQTFLIKTSNHLAALYDNASVLENHHWRSAMAVLHESKLLTHLSLQEWQEVEWQIKSLILATDMTRQQEFYTRFKKFLDNKDLDVRDRDHRHFILQIALKCADISNPCRNWKESKAWSERVCDEFFQQGDLERNLHLAVTQNCDRFSTTVAKVQAGFMEYVVVPLFKEWQRFLPTTLSQHMIDNIHQNKLSWLSLIQEQEKENQVSESGQQEGRSSNARSSHSSSSSTQSGDSSDSCIASIHDIECEVAGVAERMDENMPWNVRRHSLPNSILRREFPQLYVRRESYPRAFTGRRRSLPKTTVHQALSYDRFMDKVSENILTNGGTRVSLDSLLTRPKISTLSPSLEASLLTSPVMWTETEKSGLLTKPVMSVMMSVGNSCQPTNKSHLSIGKHPGELVVATGSTFHSRSVLASIPTNNNANTGELTAGTPMDRKPHDSHAASQLQSMSGCFKSSESLRDISREDPS